MWLTHSVVTSLLFNQAKSAAEFIHVQGTGADLENLPVGGWGRGQTEHYTLIQMISGEYSNQRLRLRMDPVYLTKQSIFLSYKTKQLLQNLILLKNYKHETWNYLEIHDNKIILIISPRKVRIQPDRNCPLQTLLYIILSYD